GGMGVERHARHAARAWRPELQATVSVALQTVSPSRALRTMTQSRHIEHSIAPQFLRRWSPRAEPCNEPGVAARLPESGALVVACSPALHADALGLVAHAMSGFTLKVPAVLAASFNRNSQPPPIRDRYGLRWVCGGD
ncbi:MAG: hypothetical protein J0M20_12515, partial [Burkholderiales bacterium]|nr:hypothetical protein [Burkholderiales bacterium]